MSSSNNQRIDYPSMPAATPHETTTVNSVTNVDAPSNDTPNDNPNQAVSIRRQRRSSGPPLGVSLDPILTDEAAASKATPKQRQYEIARIVSGNVDEALSNYYMGTNNDKQTIFKCLSILVHPDHNTGDWKARGTLAQQMLNDAREKFIVPGEVLEPEIGEKPKAAHDRLYGLRIFVGSVRQLHRNPDRATAVEIINRTNKRIEEINTRDGLPRDCGIFPLRYLQYSYRNAHQMVQKYKDSDDEEFKANAAIGFKSIAEGTEEFCEERGLPSTWAWNCKDISRLPAYLTEYESSENEAEPSSNQDDPMDLDSPQPSDPISQPILPQDQAGPSSNQEDATELYTSNNEVILYKRNFFGGLQYLVKEPSGLHVWKKQYECEKVDPEQVPPIMKPTKEFIRDRRRQYKGITWIAMEAGEAITRGVGQHPPITMNVEWQDRSEDTALWRSEVIKIAGKDKVDEAVVEHLPLGKSVQYGGQTVFVKAYTDSGLVKGEQKAISRIQKAENSARLAASQSAHGGVSVPIQPAVMQSVAPQATVSQSTPAPQSESAQPAVNQHGSTLPESTQTAVPQAPTQSTQPLDLNNPQMQMMFQQFVQLMSQQMQPAMISQQA